HRNSIRIGWMPAKDSNKVNYCVYWYNNSTRITTWALNNVFVGSVVTAQILKMSEDEYFVEFYLSSGKNVLKVCKFQLPLPILKFQLNPYFGGEKKIFKEHNIIVCKH